MGKVLSNKESRRRIKRAVLKSLKVVNANTHITGGGTGIEQITVFPTESNEGGSNVENSSNEEYEIDFFNQSSESMNAEMFLDKDFKTTVNLCDDLKDWSVVYNITQRALSANLKIFKSVGHDLPSDARTLLKTPRKSKVVRTQDGTYYYANLFRNLKILLSKLDFDIGDMYIDFNIDGLPLSRSSRSDLWPILARVYNTKFKSDVFLIGGYHGISKPKDLNLFFKHFVREILDLNEGFYIGDKKYNICIGRFICDAPATSFIKCIKQFNGYFGCGKCRQEGEGLVGKTIFPEIDCDLRTDENFRQRVDYEHHLSDSPLEPVVGKVRLPVDCRLMI